MSHKQPSAGKGRVRVPKVGPDPHAGRVEGPDLDPFEGHGEV